ncbi:MAG: SDR family oxidoreductase [Chloroflexi bacterium]|nr:SDR family oxidoreductase [Chloroflexota bacterium]
MHINTVRPLEGRVAWVTGSSRGLGRAIATYLAEIGAKVAIHGTSPTSTRAFNEADSLQTVADQISADCGAEVLCVTGDLSDPLTVQHCVEAIRARFGQIDILVNNAGGDIGAAGTGAPNAGKPAINDAVDIAYDDMLTVLNRNLMTCMLCSQAVAPEMRTRRAGRIINIGSIAGTAGVPQSAIYATAKAAVHEYTRCLALHLRPYNVTANVVAPGDTVTQRFVHSRVIDEAKVLTGGTLERYGQPIEVARAVAFLAGEEAAFISGQVLRVDGATQTWPA